MCVTFGYSPSKYDTFAVDYGSFVWDIKFCVVSRMIFEGPLKYNVLYVSDTWMNCKAGQWAGGHFFPDVVLKDV